MTRAPSALDLLGSWSLDPGLAGALALSAVAYAAGVRAAPRWPRWRSVAFAAGLAALAVALESGVDGWADRLLAVHMAQHVLLTMAAAPLLVLGAPERLALRALPRGARQRLARGLRGRLARVLARPLAGWLALPAAMVALHAPAVLAYLTGHPWAHHLAHLVLIAAGVLFWVPVAGGELAPRRLSALGRLAYLFAAMAPMGAIGAVLTTAPDVLYPRYAASAARLGVTAIDDQSLAGAVMWVGGGYALVAATLAAVWAALVAEERRARVREAYEDARVAA